MLSNLELIHRDEINVSYIIQLLIKLKASNKKDKEQAEKEILNLLNSEAHLRSKKELIEQFYKSGKKVLGVCLGAQLIANTFGANVYKGKSGKEIGWDFIHLNVFPWRCNKSYVIN